MNLFENIAVEDTIKSPKYWTLEDCKENLKVIFKESKTPNLIDVSVRLQGLTMLKIHKDKTTLTVEKGAITKDEILEKIKTAEPMIKEAHERLIASLKKAQSSRETTYKRKPREEKPQLQAALQGIEKDGQDFLQPSQSM